MLTKQYLIAGREGKELLQKLREFLSEKLHLYREFSIFKKTGGRSGDLDREIMEYEVYVHGHEGGTAIGEVEVYSVVDDGCNGYALLLTVLSNLSKDSDESVQLQAFLADADFVSKYSSFKERPMSYKSFRSFLDTTPRLNLDEFDFEHEKRKQVA